MLIDRLSSSVRHLRFTLFVPLLGWIGLALAQADTITLTSRNGCSVDVPQKTLRFQWLGKCVGGSANGPGLSLGESSEGREDQKPWMYAQYAIYRAGKLDSNRMETILIGRGPGGENVLVRNLAHLTVETSLWPVGSDAYAEFARRVNAMARELKAAPPAKLPRSNQDVRVALGATTFSTPTVAREDLGSPTPQPRQDVAGAAQSPAQKQRAEADGDYEFLKKKSKAQQQQKPAPKSALVAKLYNLRADAQCDPQPPSYRRESTYSVIVFGENSSEHDAAVNLARKFSDFTTQASFFNCTGVENNMPRLNLIRIEGQPWTCSAGKWVGWTASFGTDAGRRATRDFDAVICTDDPSKALDALMSTCLERARQEGIVPMSSDCLGRLMFFLVSPETPRPLAEVESKYMDMRRRGSRNLTIWWSGFLNDGRFLQCDTGERPCLDRLRSRLAECSATKSTSCLQRQ